MRREVVAAVAVAFGAGVALGAPGSKEADEALAAFKKAYASKDASARLAAIEQVAPVQHARVVEALGGALAKDRDPGVRRAAAKALGRQWAPQAPLTLARCLDPDDPAREVTTEVIGALGETGSDAAVAPLAGLLRPRRKGVADDASFTGPALAALGKTGSARAVEEVLAFLNRQTAVNSNRRGQGGGNDPLAKQAESVLETLTGQRHSGATAWRKWWTDAKGSLREVAVFRCPSSGQTFEKTPESPRCRDAHPGCGYLLRTRLAT